MLIRLGRVDCPFHLGRTVDCHHYPMGTKESEARIQRMDHREMESLTDLCHWFRLYHMNRALRWRLKYRITNTIDTIVQYIQIDHFITNTMVIEHSVQHQST